MKQSMSRSHRSRTRLHTLKDGMPDSKQRARREEAQARREH